MDLLDNVFFLVEQNVIRQDKNLLFWNFCDLFIMCEVKGLCKEVQFVFQNFFVCQCYDKVIDVKQKELVDFCFLYEWFLVMCVFQRIIYVYVGLINFGKMYQVIKVFENVKIGFYVGLFCLLVIEIYYCLVVRGKKCVFIIGEEIQILDDLDVYFKSCIVEMVLFNQFVDVCVIDEIQMFEDLV